MEPILGDRRLDRRDLGDLMPPRLDILAVQAVAAPSAPCGLAVEGLVDLFGGDQGPTVPGMAGLTATPAGPKPTMIVAVRYWSPRQSPTHCSAIRDIDGAAVRAAATPAAPMPTAIVAVTVLVAAAITDTLLVRWFAT